MSMSMAARREVRSSIPSLRMTFFFSSRRRHTRFSRDWSSDCALPIYQRANPGAAFLVGLRADGESINRRRAVTKNPVEICGKRVYWAPKRENTTTLYPIYDWDFHDVWKYIDEHKLPYSKIYDMLFKKRYP